jgi:hypothetical protein
MGIGRSLGSFAQICPIGVGKWGLELMPQPELTSSGRKPRVGPARYDYEMRPRETFTVYVSVLGNRDQGRAKG